MKVVFRKSNAAQKCSKEWRKMNMGIQLGIVGYGGMGGFHHRNASKIEGVQVVGAYDIEPRAGTGGGGKRAQGIFVPGGFACV